MAKSEVVDKGLSLWQLIIAFLSIYVLVALLLQMLIKFDQETVILLDWIDNLICLIFIGDFSYNLLTEKDKLSFLKWGWIDLVSSIPFLTYFRWGRIWRVIRLVRVLRSIRSFKRIFEILRTDVQRNVPVFILMLSSIFIIFSPIVVLSFEKSASTSNIKTALDAIWWVVVTISSVDFGENYPVTQGGKILNVFLKFIGISIFSSVTAMVASYVLKVFTKSKESDINSSLAEISDRLERIEKSKDRKDSN